LPATVPLGEAADAVQDGAIAQGQAEGEELRAADTVERRVGAKDVHELRLSGDDETPGAVVEGKPAETVAEHEHRASLWTKNDYQIGALVRLHEALDRGVDSSESGQLAPDGRKRPVVDAPFQIDHAPREHGGGISIVRDPTQMEAGGAVSAT
jgi:hypothetical protein